MTALTPDLEQARRHLLLLDKNVETFVFQTFDDSKRKDPSLSRVLCGTLAQRAQELSRLQARGAGVFVTVNRSKNGGRKKEDITAYRAIWREADEPNLPALPLSPHFVVETSPGHKHEYILIEPSEALDTGDAIMGSMVRDYGSDPCAKDRSRVLRLAGFFHLKDPANPYFVQIIHESGGLPYSMEYVAKSIPPAAKKKSSLPTTGTSGKYGQAALAAEISRLAGASEGTRNDQLNQVAFSLSQLCAGGELSANQVEAALMGTALSIGLTETEARATIKSGMEAGMKEPRIVPERARRESPTTGANETESPVESIEPILKKVSLKNIATVELPAPVYAIYSIAPESEVTLMGGHGGAGKSILALILCAHYAASVPWFGFEVKGERVLYVSLEDPPPLNKYRLKKICEVYDLPVEKIEKNLTILDGSEGDGALCTESSEYGVRSVKMTPLLEEIKKASRGCGLIVIDNASDAYDADENSRRQVRRFIRELRTLARANNAGLILLAHIDKVAARFGANGNTYSGTTAWHNSVRSRLALTEKDGHVELVQEKLNLGQKLDRAISLTWIDGVLIPDSNIAEGLAVEGQEDLDKVAVLAAIQKAIGDGVDVPTARTGPANCHGTLERLPDLPGHLRGRRGRDGFYRVLSELQREGTLTTEEYRTASRNVRQRFCVGSGALHIIPNTLCVEPTKLTQVSTSVHGVRKFTGTHETHETHAEDVLEVLK